jgi:hypothetical protein
MNKILIAMLILLAIGLIVFIVGNIGSSSNSSSKCTSVTQEIIFITRPNYDRETQENMEETFFNLVLLREIIDNGNKETHEILIKPVIQSLSKTVQKIAPVLEREKEIVVTIKNTTFKLKKDGMGNICFGSPTYFMCLNPSTNELYPYINDMIVVYHLIKQRSMGIFGRDKNVETILNTILSNVLAPCDEGSSFFIDYSTKYDHIILTKLFNSKLDTDLLSSLMMIVLFSNNSLKSIEDVSINNKGMFKVTDQTLMYLQQFHKLPMSNIITYKDMKHALYNLCYAKYTVHGFSAMTYDEKEIQKRKELIDEMLKTSTCKPKMSTDVVVTPPPIIVPPTTPTADSVVPVLPPVENKETSQEPLKSILKEPTIVGENFEDGSGLGSLEYVGNKKKVNRKVTFV